MPYSQEKRERKGKLPTGEADSTGRRGYSQEIQ